MAKNCDGKCLVPYFVRYSVSEDFFSFAGNLVSSVNYILESQATFDGKIIAVGLDNNAVAPLIPVSRTIRTNWRNNSDPRLTYRSGIILSGVPSNWVPVLRFGSTGINIINATGSFPPNGDNSIFNSEFHSATLVSVRRADNMPDDCCECESTDQTITCASEFGGICCISKDKIRTWCATLRSPPP